MPLTDNPVGDLRRAYEILDVSPIASAHVIKQAYRKLAKRWHPDLYSPGTQAHAEAVQMMKTINEAYSCVLHAPLRYGMETRATSSRQANPVSPRGNAPPPRAQQGWSYTEEKYPARSSMFARYEFWTRFVFGALLGVAVSLFLNARFYPALPSALAIPLALAEIVSCGYAAARLGDEFWYLAVRRWWW